MFTLITLLQRKKLQLHINLSDYTTALESYDLWLFASNHELRVVILSNLASVNKLLGHLKESLDNIKDAEALFLPQEILSDYEIAEQADQVLVY